MSNSYILIAVVLVAVVVFAGNQNPTNPPGATFSYTLEDIYNRLKDGTEGDTTTFTEPVAGPGTPTMHTLNEIMGIAPVKDDANGADTGDVLTGKTFWGLNTALGQWGPQTGTMPKPDNVSGPDGSKTFSIPDGFYSGKTATANDADLVAGKIKKGVNIFGVVGSYRDQDRFTDHGNGTVTDLSTKLMWTKNANLPNDRKTWQWGVDYCDTLNFAGHSDWRLPEIWELFSLIDKREIQPSLPDGHPFTDIPGTSSYYWSSTTSAVASGYAYYVWPLQGEVGTLMKTIAVAFVWPVRASQ